MYVRRCGENVFDVQKCIPLNVLYLETGFSYAIHIVTYTLEPATLHGHPSSAVIVVPPRLLFLQKQHEPNQESTSRCSMNQIENQPADVVIHSNLVESGKSRGSQQDCQLPQMKGMCVPRHRVITLITDYDMQVVRRSRAMIDR
jgi:hypothetical protein